MTNPYSAPESTEELPPGERWPSTLLAPFLSAIVTIPIGLILLGMFRLRPDFLVRLDFILPLIAGAAVSAVVLRGYTSANWLVRVILAPPLAFLVYFPIDIAVMYALR
ncbi:hypothetical protein [Pseudoxanthomonas sp. PXM02]|uniref:hypothetical protein n=1 Tax=Pseudoxanthomonas sp. PXM02 TaxID=2769294 RepID=UPI0017816035|nr:hypothetical protein [Pseudoxanthomonas sp. PXM02]MBD9480051.1 hypothetical protein [Pseudoxanthomonas sp. PXM02]